jgi:hypothetical protein
MSIEDDRSKYAYTYALCSKYVEVAAGKENNRFVLLLTVSEENRNSHIEDFPTHQICKLQG